MEDRESCGDLPIQAVSVPWRCQKDEDKTSTDNMMLIEKGTYETGQLSKKAKSAWEDCEKQFTSF
jgi:hypothetical protein